MLKVTYLFVTMNFIILSSLVQGEEIPPILSVTPDPSLGCYFGLVYIGDISNREFIVQNLGGGLLNGFVIIESGDLSQEDDKEKIEEIFKINGDNFFSLGPNQSKNVVISFCPKKEKEYTAKVKITASENQNIDITVKGTGRDKEKQYNIFGCGAKQNFTQNKSYLLDGSIVLLVSSYLLMNIKKRKLNIDYPRIDYPSV